MVIAVGVRPTRILAENECAPVFAFATVKLEMVEPTRDTRMFPARLAGVLVKLDDVSIEVVGELGIEPRTSAL